MIDVVSGSLADFDAVMRLMDEAVAWLAAAGRPGQWGTEPLSGRQKSVDHMRKEVADNDLWLARINGEVVGAMLLGDHPRYYINPVAEPEIYLHLLVASRRHIGAGIGRALVVKAIALAMEEGIGLIQVDCYAGDDRKLVTAYERLGFTPTTAFKVENWPGQLLELRLTDLAPD